MMSGMPLETYWAFNERWNNKFCYKVAFCWLFLLRQQSFGIVKCGCVSRRLYFSGWLGTGKGRICWRLGARSWPLCKYEVGFRPGKRKLLLFVVRICITASRADGLNKPFMCVCVCVRNVLILNSPEHAAFCSAKCMDMPLYTYAYTSNSRHRKHISTYIHC